MNDIRSVLSQFKEQQGGESPEMCVIPGLFFDHILIQFKLSRPETLVLMYLYRQVWDRPNLNAKYGIGPLQTFEKIASSLQLKTEEVISVLHTLEKHQLIQTVRVGQYFVRKFFTEEFDLKYGQTYDEFF